jgi:hypothetical protein
MFCVLEKDTSLATLIPPTAAFKGLKVKERFTGEFDLLAKEMCDLPELRQGSRTFGYQIYLEGRRESLSIHGTNPVHILNYIITLGGMVAVRICLLAAL